MGLYEPNDLRSHKINTSNNKNWWHEMSICKTCGKSVAKNARTCPHCGATNRASYGWLVLLCIVVFIITCRVAIDDSPTSTENTSIITKAEFDMLKDGMTYQQCVDIVGGEGFMSTEMTVGNVQMTMYSWKGNGNFGSNANATFYDGKLTSKTQVGLE